MKKLIIILVILTAFCFTQSQTPKSATYINKLGEVMVTDDGGITWRITNKPYQKYYWIDNNIQPQQLNDVTSMPVKTAIFIKNGAKITYDGGTTWQDISTEELKNTRTKDEILLYPNPVTKDYVNISLTSLRGSNKATAYVYDMMGRNVITTALELQTGNSANFSLNVSGLQNGKYLLKLVTDTEQFITNLTIER